LKGNSYDTRFLIELYYSSDEMQLAKIRETILRAKPNYLSTAVLSEIYRLTLQKEGKDVADIRANSLAKDFHIIDVNKEIAVEAAIIRNRNDKIPFADTLIASTAKILKVPCYTDDPHFKDIQGLTTKWI
jgi:predicted nucleic acid-binding protein